MSLPKKEIKTLPAAIMYSLYTTVNKTEFEWTEEMSSRTRL